MGHNLISGCHTCRTKVYWYRNEPERPIRKFYEAHSDCIRKDKKAVQTNIDQIQEEAWMEEYADDKLQQP